MKVVLLIGVLVVMVGVSSSAKIRGSGTGRIVGGVEINPSNRNLFKHQVGIIFDDRFWCGGSIISKNSIITAAHCTHGRSFATVFIGLYDKSKLSSATQIVKIKKENWVDYPEYDWELDEKDLAIINLPESIKFGEFVGPIEVECNDKERHENERVIISGWGKNSDSASATTTILRTAIIKTAPSSLCVNVFGTRILPSMICVEGKNNVGTCQGDSGGPIVSTKNGKLIGATSYGAEGCEQDNPRVFTRLSSFAEWIQANTIDHIKNC